MVIVKKAIESTEWQEKIYEFISHLWIDSHDISYYILAFIHRSIVNERPDFAPEHNERLEFLGDAVLELIITDTLYNNFPKKTEWELTDIRSALVRGSNLAKISRELWLKDYLFLWKWEELWGWRDNDYLLANCLEAFLWAIYLDLGMKEAKKFVDTYVYPSVDIILEQNLFKDYKSLIQEFSQAEYDITPNYDVISDDGPDHNKVFEVWVYIWKKLVGTGKWSSKKKAQENAAENAYLQKDNWNITK